MDSPDLRGDVIAMVPPSTYVLPLRVSKAQAEDRQIASFARALGLAEGAHVTWVRSTDQDAPDRTITVDGHRMEIELTALTAGKLRAERQRLSDVAERVRDAIAGQVDLSASLAGCTVDLSDAADLPMPKKSGARAAAARVVALLAVLASTGAVRPLPYADRAVAAARDKPVDSQDISDARAETRDSVDGIHVRLARSGISDMCIVTHASQCSLTLSEARSALRDRLLDKDSKTREHVVVCAGDPDRDGLVLPFDLTAFELLSLFGFGELPPVSYIKRAWLHLTDTAELIPLIRVGKSELRTSAPT